MATILGLDLGVCSIGWAEIKELDKLLGWGARIFTAGMDDDVEKGKGVSRCSKRRLFRAQRLAVSRRREHKNELIQVLQQAKLLPEDFTAEYIISVDRKILKALGNNNKYNAHIIPYLLRKQALDKPLPPELLGRAIFHLGQRRGYLSNRKQAAKDPESGIVYQEINDLKQKMQQANARTLGEYFSTVNPEAERIRTRYTGRSMFEHELKLICHAQRHLISEELEKSIHHAIFFQRKLKSCKHLIGGCRLEYEEKRCQFSCDDAQLFRIYQTVNNLRITNRSGEIIKLSAAEREAVLTALAGMSGQLNNSGKITLKNLSKIAKLGKGLSFTLGNEEKEIYGNQLNNLLYRAFGERCAAMTLTERQNFLHDLSAIEKKDVLIKRAKNFWHLDDNTANMVGSLTLPDDYCNFSVKAIRRLLPDLEAGIALNTIIKLQYPETFSAASQVYDFLPQLEDTGIELRNPVVHRTLTELRRVVNAAIRQYGKPDYIKVELARDLKNSNKERERIYKKNFEREKERLKIAERITKDAGITEPSGKDILKVMLADECKWECPYTGKSINITSLLAGKEFHIEHIIPLSRSFDDSYRNKTLCYGEENQAKNNKTPFEAYGGERYEEILQRVSRFKGAFAEAKLELFQKTELDEQEFLARNLSDTRYASKLAMQYLGCLYGGIVDKDGKQRIFASSGMCTALVRRAWGGNYLLGEGEKGRNDHRHHAIDAFTVALTSPAMVKKIAKLTEARRKELLKSNKPILDNAIFLAARAALDDAKVSIHVVNKVRGELHNATIYSKNYGDDIKHVKIALADLKTDDIPTIVDPAIRKQVEDKLQKLNISDPKIAFKMPENYPALPDRHGNKVNIIKKVRCRKTHKTRSVGHGADGRREVANGDNHLLAVFAQLDKNGNEVKWDGEIVSGLEARLRLQKGIPIFNKNRPGWKFKFTLKKGDYVKWAKDGIEYLCVIRVIALPQLSCCPVKDARKQQDLKSAKQWFQPTLAGAFAGNMQKFSVTPLGELRRAND